MEVVGKGRLELPRFAAHDPKSCSSTYFDTSPSDATLSEGGMKENVKRPIPCYWNHNTGLAATSMLSICASSPFNGAAARRRNWQLSNRFEAPRSNGQWPPATPGALSPERLSRSGSYRSCREALRVPGHPLRRWDRPHPGDPAGQRNPEALDHRFGRARPMSRAPRLPQADLSRRGGRPGRGYL